MSNNNVVGRVENAPVRENNEQTKWEVREGEQLQGGHEIAVRGSSATRGEEEVSA